MQGNMFKIDCSDIIFKMHWILYYVLLNLTWGIPIAHILKIVYLCKVWISSCSVESVHLENYWCITSTF